MDFSYSLRTTTGMDWMIGKNNETVQLQNTNA
jgi:hypothetical protein